MTVRKLSNYLQPWIIWAWERFVLWKFLFFPHFKVLIWNNLFFQIRVVHEFDCKDCVDPWIDKLMSISYDLGSFFSVETRPMRNKMDSKVFILGQIRIFQFHVFMLSVLSSVCTLTCCVIDFVFRPRKDKIRARSVPSGRTVIIVPVFK